MRERKRKRKRAIEEEGEGEKAREPDRKRERKKEENKRQRERERSIYMYVYVYLYVCICVYLQCVAGYRSVLQGVEGCDVLQRCIYVEKWGGGGYWFEVHYICARYMCICMYTNMYTYI